MLEIQIKGHRNSDDNVPLPLCRIKFNNSLLFDGSIFKLAILKFNVELQKNNILHIEHYGKLPWETSVDQDGNVESDRAIELMSIKINGYEIPKVLMYKQKFFVDWWDHDIDAFDRDNEPVPGFITNNSYFGWNGYYEYVFSGNLLKNYYGDLWLQEEMANTDLTHFQEVAGEIKETYTLYGNETEITEDFNKTIFDLLEIIQKN